MEMTQKLECTQELYNTQTERTCPEQIGFLGICGTKYPIIRGPNKIGRDSQKCSIILDYKSISRQHAVIVVNKTDYLLMDLDAANKTKLAGKTLKPFIPSPISDGEMVQFGEVFGVFRVLEDDDDLPMTQAIDIPDTPIATRCHTKTNGLATTIPESPDVSDRDDSFIVPSQPKLTKKFKSPNNNFIKSSGKTISIQPVGSNKIDNVYWSSSKRSLSLNMDESNDRLNDSAKCNKGEEINDKTIYEMDTQVPTCNESTDSIYSAETQVPSEFNVSPSIHSLETQLPPPAESLPEVCKIENQQDLHFDIFTAKTESDINIFNAETQLAIPKKDENGLNQNEALPNTSKDNGEDKSNTSKQEILFEDIDNESFLDDFESQPLLTENTSLITNIEQNIDPKTDETVNVTNIEHVQPLQRDVCIKSDSSTDCEDIGDLTQNLPENKVVDDDLTDCEDEIDLDYNKLGSAASKDNLEDLPTQIIEDINKPAIPPFEDMPTQVVIANEVDFEDLPTQVLSGNLPENPVYSEEMMSPFKVPFLKSVKKRKDTEKLDSKTSKKTPTKTCSNASDDDNDDKYYAATQQLFDDLCSQRELTPELINKSDEQQTNNEEDSKENVTSTKTNTSSSSDTYNKCYNSCVDNLNSQQIRDVIGVDKKVAKLKRMPSDPSDSELTPTKLRPFKFMNTDLPNSQEIKCHRSLTTQSIATESSSESEVENDSEEHTPILFKKKKTKVNAKVNLTERFDVEKLPTRISTRVKKPTKISESNNMTFLKPRYLTEQEDDIDKDIIIENISRLKHNAAKYKSKDISKDEKITGPLKERQSGNTETKKNKNRDMSKEESNTLEEKQIKNTNTKKVMKGNGKDSVKELKSNKNPESKRKAIKTHSQNVNAEQDSTTLSSRSTRSSRTRQPKAESKNDQNESLRKVSKDKKDVTSKKDVEQPVKVDRRKRSHKLIKVESSPESEKEVRRSKRQRTKNVVKETKPVSILKKTNTRNDQSTVYNISSESNTDSPKTFKRPASSEVEELSSKRLRSNNSSLSSRSTNTSMNSTASNISFLKSSSSCRVKQQYVLFTAFPADEVKSKLEKLGAIIVSDVSACTMVLTIQIKRTFKLLCAIGLGKPIVGPSWVQACVDTNTIVDPWLYLMKDEAAESRFKFSLRRTLTGKRDFLKGYKVSSTPAVMPNAQEMKLIVESSGGTWDEDLPNWVCVSTSADKSLWPSLRRRGAIVVSTEFILGGVLRQKLDIEGNKLK